MTEQRVIVDAGGDDVLVITGTEGADLMRAIAGAVQDLTRKRRDRLAAAPEPVRVAHRWWLDGHQLYGRRRTADGLDIWWEAPPMEDTVAREVELGATEDGLVQLLSWAAAGLVFGRGYSVACPEGEAGSVHVADLRVVSRDRFLQARRDGWTSPDTGS